MNPERYTLTVEALPRPVPAAVRLRALLKALLRAWGFRCLSVVPSDPKPADAKPEATGGTTGGG